MRINVVPSISVGPLIEDQVFYADVPRGLGVHAVVEVTVGGKTYQITGALLRAALLSTVHTGPWPLASVGADRFALQLDPESRSSTIAHLDGDRLRTPKYWLYRRGDSGPTRLTRWTRAGHISQRELADATGKDATSLGAAALGRIVVDVVAAGLPDTLDVHTGSRIQRISPSQEGWLDVPPGALQANPDRTPIHLVDDLGHWTGRTN